MFARVIGGLLVVAFAGGCGAPSLAAPAPTPTSAPSDDYGEYVSGTEQCVGCRLTRRVDHDESGERSVEYVPNACADWVATHVDGHEHAWFKVGCWITSNDALARLRSAPLHDVEDGEWLVFLVCQTAPERARWVQLATQGWGSENEVRAAVQAWRSAPRPDSNG